MNTKKLLLEKLNLYLFEYATILALIDMDINYVSKLANNFGYFSEVKNMPFIISKENKVEKLKYYSDIIKSHIKNYYNTTNNEKSLFHIAAIYKLFSDLNE